MEDKSLKATLSKAISLIQEARHRAITGAYGEQDVEYADVKERFDEAIELISSIIDQQ